MQFADLSIDEIREIEINGNSPVFEFEEGKSHFAAFRLVSTRKPITVEFATSRNNEGFWRAPLTVFVPQFDFFDKEFMPIVTGGQSKNLSQAMELFRP
ncbi:MAG: hypothetical protein WBD34_21290, partial [Burkholderiaceae bacterium]